MLIRKAAPQDREEIVRIARECDVDYPGMEKDDFLVAVDEDRIMGIVGLKRHPDCLELCGLGVDGRNRGRGIGRRLVLKLLAGIRGEVYLGTIIPGFFEGLGFERVASPPRSMLKDPEWCAGCRPDLCTVMVRRGA